MTRIFIGVASNDEAEKNIPEALAHLAKVSRIVAISTFHRTPAVAGPEHRPFVNGVVAIETSLHATVVRRRLLKGIERALGREESERHAKRPIDLDLLLEWVRGPRRRPPRPHDDVLERFFVAHALLEVAGDIRLALPSESLADHVATLSPWPMHPLNEFTEGLRNSFLGPSPGSVDQEAARLGSSIRGLEQDAWRARAATEETSPWP